MMGYDIPGPFVSVICKVLNKGQAQTQRQHVPPVLTGHTPKFGFFNEDHLMMIDQWIWMCPFLLTTTPCWRRLKSRHALLDNFIEHVNSIQ